jgi:tRNA(Phe) wybutosine-synthesizing methylase Tyw3
MSPLSAAALSASSKSFENRKVQCLAKRDKSSAGRIDARCESLCDLVNAKFPFYYTTSSCSGRSYLYRGFGAKAGEALHSFVRYRVSHDRIDFPSEYFDLSTVPAAGHNGSGVDYYHPVDPTTSSVNAHAPTNDDGCGIVGAALVAANDDTEQEADASEVGTREMGGQEVEEPETRRPFQPLWLRYEPFILHVACRSLSAAWHLMRVARPSFKNVGLTAWNSHPENGGNATSSNNRSSQNGRYVVAIWGDEGLDMPLESPDGRVDLTQVLGHEYLASLVNDRHERNWGKMERFEQGLRELSVHEATVGDVSPEDDAESDIPSQTVGATAAPRSFDVIGDVAVLNTVTTTDPAELAEAGAAILRKNRALRVAVLRNSSLIGAERAPGDRGLTLLAGARRDPLITTYVRLRL